MSVTTVAGSFITLNTIDSDHYVDGSINLVHIGANQIDGTKLALASQAAGDIMYYNGTDWIRLVKGTADQVLTMNDGATAPNWEAAASSDIGVRVYHNTTQSVANNTTTPITFNQYRYDTDTMHDNSTNNTRLTATTAGKYIITGHARFATNTSGRRNIGILLGGAAVIAQTSMMPISDGGSTELMITTHYELSASTYVELTVYQSSGGALLLQNQANYSNEFMMHKVG